MPRVLVCAEAPRTRRSMGNGLGTGQGKQKTASNAGTQLLTVGSTAEGGRVCAHPGYPSSTDEIELLKVLSCKRNGLYSIKGYLVRERSGQRRLFEAVVLRLAEFPVLPCDALQNSPFLPRVLSHWVHNAKMIVLCHHRSSPEHGHCELGSFLSCHLRFDLTTVRALSAEVLACMEALHSVTDNWRCLDFDDLALGTDNHLHISMPSVARMLVADKAAAEYSSPEMIEGRPFHADLWRSRLWSFGCILFEMAVGLSPFYSADAGRMREAVLTQPVPCPSRVFCWCAPWTPAVPQSSYPAAFHTAALGLLLVNQRLARRLPRDVLHLILQRLAALEDPVLQAYNLICRCLEKDPALRCTLAEVKASHFFEGSDWRLIYDRASPLPIDHLRPSKRSNDPDEVWVDYSPRDEGDEGHPIPNDFEVFTFQPQ